ncbi:MAG: SDR family oxidoreductase [Proteobacteria bacterium]|nr:SDR family oxidoreductase [Pseudomonadota bacterium]
MDLQLKGKKAIVTGGSRGIGRAIAGTLAAEGAELAICARGAEGVEAAVKELEASGARVVGKAVDVGDGEALQGFIRESAETLGGLDILVSNPSGGNGTDEASWRANFEIDLLGAVRSVEAAVPLLAQSDAASVLLISSTAAVETFMGPTSYNAIKAALLTHANGLSQALGPQGIRVNVISPGPIYFAGGAWEQIEQTMKPMYDNAVKNCAIGRMGTPEEVANAAAFLVSPAASLITGVNLVADGGFTKRVNF